MNRTVLSVSSEHPGLVQINEPNYDLLASLGITFVRIPGRQEKGYIFRHYDPINGYTETQGNFPIVIPPEGDLIASPILVRVVNEELRKKFNAQLKVIRRSFKVRAKLGAFANVSLKKLLEDMRNDEGSRSKKFSLYAPDAFVRAVNLADETNIESFNYLLYVMYGGQYWYYEDSWLESTALCEQFERTLNCHREKSKLALNVVTYEVPDANLVAVEATAV